MLLTIFIFYWSPFIHRKISSQWSQRFGSRKFDGDIKSELLWDVEWLVVEKRSGVKFFWKSYLWTSYLEINWSSQRKHHLDLVVFEGTMQRSRDHEQRKFMWLFLELLQGDNCNVVTERSLCLEKLTLQ